MYARPSSLYECCLLTIVRNLSNSYNLSSTLCLEDKSRLLHWLVDHDRIDTHTSASLASLSYYLVSSQYKEIRFANSKQLDDRLLLCFAGVKCHLTVLSLVNLKNITDYGISELIKSQTPYLRHLHLEQLTNFTGSCFSSLKFDSLVKLTMKSCNKIKSQYIGDLLSCNGQLKELNILDYHSMKNPELMFENISQDLRLERLNLSGLRNASDDCLRLVAEQCGASLRRLNIFDMTQVTYETLAMIIHYEHLEQLELGYCKCFVRYAPDSSTEVGFNVCASLTLLDITGVQITSRQLFVRELSALPRLKTLKTYGVPCVDDLSIKNLLVVRGDNLVHFECMNLSNDGLKSIVRYCSNLHTLCLSGGQFNGVTLYPLFSNVQKSSKIVRLSFNLMKDFDYSVLTLLATNCAYLLRLDLANIECVDDILLGVIGRNCPLLQILDIKACSKVTDCGMDELTKHCHQLQVLTLSGVNKLTDASLFHLAARTPRLHTLYLNGVQNVSSHVLNYLKDCCMGSLYAKNFAPNRSTNHTMARNLDNGEFCRVDRMIIN